VETKTITTEKEINSIMAKLTFKEHSAYKKSDEEFVKVDYKRLYESQYPSEAKLSPAIAKKIKQIKGITKQQAEILLTIPQPTLMTLIQQMSQLTMGESKVSSSVKTQALKHINNLMDLPYGSPAFKKEKQSLNKILKKHNLSYDKLFSFDEELQEKSKLVTSVEQVFDIISRKLKSEMGKRYKKSKSDGLAFVNSLAQIVGMKATDKKQAPNKMFLKMDYELDEAVKPNKKTITWATKKVKELDTVINQMIKNKMPKEIWQSLQKVKFNLENFIEDNSNLVMGEKLDADSDAGDYVDDFRKSDAPQFKGKSDKKIQKMAIAAYLKNKGQKE